MSSYWAAYYGDALVLTEKEFFAFQKQYLAIRGSGPDFDDEDFDLNEYDFKRCSSPDQIFNFVAILDDYTDEKYFIPFYHDGHINESIRDEEGNLIQVVETKSWRTGNFYVVYADHSRVSGRAFSDPPYSSYEGFKQEFKGKLEDYLPGDFDWDAHLGSLYYAAYA